MKEMDRERKTTSYFTCLMKEKKQQQHAFDCANRVSSGSLLCIQLKFSLIGFWPTKRDGDEVHCLWALHPSSSHAFYISYMYLHN